MVRTIGAKGYPNNLGSRFLGAARLRPKKNNPGHPTWFDGPLPFRYIIKVPTHIA